jgi:DUF971 family protein
MTQMPNYDQMIQNIAAPVAETPKRPAAPMIREGQVNVGQLNINTQGTMMMYEVINDIGQSGIQLFNTMTDLAFKEKKFEFEKFMDDKKNDVKTRMLQFDKGLAVPLINDLYGSYVGYDVRNSWINQFRRNDQ